MGPADAVRAVFEGASERFARAAARLGEHCDDHRVADCDVHLRFAGEALRGIVSPPLAHVHLDAAPRRADYTICLWDGGISRSAFSAPSFWGF